MSFRCTVSACVFVCILFVIATGCDRSHDVGDEQPELRIKDDADSYYEQIIDKRLRLEEKIFDAMELLRQTGQKTDEQRVLLKGYLGDKPVAETIELFRKGQPSEDLSVAYSLWQTLIPDETLQLQITSWIDKQQSSRVLEQFDIQIKEFENRLLLDKFLDKEELVEIDRLLAQADVDLKEKFPDVGNKALLGEEAIEKLKNDLVNWE